MVKKCMQIFDTLLSTLDKIDDDIRSCMQSF